VFKALLFSPLIGFMLAAILLLLMKLVVRTPSPYTAPEGRKPPPTPIRALLVLTCTGVSFFHGSNDGQKGMGLIMLILIGAAPTAYALNRAIPESTTPMFLQAMQGAQTVFQAHAAGAKPPTDAAAARTTVGNALKTKDVNKPEVYAALAALTSDIGRQVQSYGAIRTVPAAATPNVRKDMYLASDAVRVLGASPTGFDAEDMSKLKSLRSSLDSGTKFIPTWVKVSVALALGLGTMVGWKRIVVTVGEKIGKTHLTYAQGASAEIVAMATIGLADVYGYDQEHGNGLGADIARGHGDRGVAICYFPPDLLTSDEPSRFEAGAKTGDAYRYD
jgi:PiT family inorganic phosphate transporter